MGAQVLLLPPVSVDMMASTTAGYPAKLATARYQATVSTLDSLSPLQCARQAVSSEDSSPDDSSDITDSIMLQQQAVDHGCSNAIRFLAVDAINKANSGHPGAPLGQ